jgi:hypothetical protein
MSAISASVAARLAFKMKRAASPSVAGFATCTVGAKTEVIELPSAPPPPHAATTKEAAGIAKIAGDFSPKVLCDAANVSGADSVFVGPSRAKPSGCVITLPPNHARSISSFGLTVVYIAVCNKHVIFNADATLKLVNLFLTAYNNFLLRWVG